MTTQPKKFESEAQGTSRPATTLKDDDGTVMIVEGSPIIIGGGGSVNLNFRETAGHYEPIPGNPGLFVRPDDEIDSILVVADHVLVYNLLQYVKGKDCTVTFYTKINGASPSPVVIRSRPPGAQTRSLQITFNTGEFRAHPHNPNKPYYNHDRKLTDSVEVLNNTTGHIDRFPIPNDGVCDITILNMRPN